MIVGRNVALVIFYLFLLILTLPNLIAPLDYIEKEASPISDREANAVFEAIPIDRCNYIYLSGEYELVNNLTAITGDIYNPCIGLSGSDIIFDCKGFWIFGNENNNFGISVWGSNVTVKNCNIAYFNNSNGGGIKVASGSNSVIVNNNLLNNSIGILTASSSTTIKNNVAIGNIYSGFENRGDDNIFINNTAFSNTNIGFEITPYVFRVVYANNTAQYNNYGFYIGYKSGNSTFAGNKVNHNYVAGFLFGGANNYNTFHENEITENEYGIKGEIESSNENLIYNNKFILNTVDAELDGTNDWNISKTPSLSIVNGPYLGGNYWYSYRGADYDMDWLGDENIPYVSPGSTIYPGDYHPLLFKPAPKPSCRYNKKPGGSICS